MDLTEKTLTQTYYFHGKIINLRVDTARLPDGSIATREVIEHPGGVCVAALTEQNELLLVRQYRYPYGKVLSELPAGKRDAGEEPLITGKRELLEETGYTAGTYRFLGEAYPSPGCLNEVLYMFLATDLVPGQSQPDADEFLEVEKVPLTKAVDMVMHGEIADSKSQIAILKVWNLYSSGALKE